MKYDPQPRSTMQRPTAIQLQMPPPYVPPPIDTYDPTSAHYRYKDELIDIGEMDKIGGRCGFCLEKFWLRMKRFLHKICPCFYALFSSKEEEYQLYKAILGFPFGVAVGVLFYYAMIDRLKLNTFFRFMMGTMMLIVMSMGYARSIKIRCVVWLIFPCFFGKSGRDILMTMAIGALLTGPVSNTMDNFKESVRTVTCMTELMINMTMVRFELTGKPIFSIVRNFVGSERMDKMTGKLHKSLSPVKNEVENTKETKEEEVKAARMDAEMGTKRSDYFHEQERKNAAKLAKEDGGNKSKAFAVDTSYIKKLDYRCNNIWGGAVDVCKQAFADAWDNCLRVIPVIGYLICWPTKLDFFCLLVKLFPSPANCDASKLLNSGFGGAYSDGDDAATELTQGTKVKLEYMVKPRKGKVDAANIQDVRKGMKNEFGKKQRFFNFIITICQRIMAFAFIQIFITSFQYHNSYLSSIKFDNCYMTDYFRSIERRRRRRGRSTLVPLKKLESRILIEPTAWRLLPAEKQKFSKGTVKLVINSLLFVLIFIFDHLIFAILDIVTRHSYVVYAQKGVHDIKLQVNGTGMLAKLVRGILKGFHERHEINQKFDNLKCLPYATLTPPIYYLKVFGTIALILLLLYFEAYGLRLRRMVCSFFFPKREKQRILSLYNGTMKRRAGYARTVRHQVRRLARERHLTMEWDTWTALLNQCPLFCFWLKWVGKGKTTCVACREEEDETFHFCDTPGCNFAYCPSCWEDLRRHCYACSPESADEESSLSEGMFGSDDDNPDAKDD
ncbi:hypothetical protein RvY_13053-1 [Ramazzottius varieornatus]|uniref:Uncharacterized protein n=1 Tax=Ramazzottius varieornatus TaxID=947166 RepID=A0A1D1VU66_RAMVA|nr:hypothetical protein RvY_13053-1 [Ramazzottius varieornatus]